MRQCWSVSVSDTLAIVLRSPNIVSQKLVRSKPEGGMAAVNERPNSLVRGKSMKDSKSGGGGGGDGNGGGHKTGTGGGGVKRVTSLKVKRVNSQKSIGYVVEQ